MSKLLVSSSLLFSGVSNGKGVGGVNNRGDWREGEGENINITLA